MLRQENGVVEFEEPGLKLLRIINQNRDKLRMAIDRIQFLRI